MDRMTNVVMTMTVDNDVKTDYANECQIRLYHPLSAHTAFRIIETPMRQPNRFHGICKSRGVSLGFLDFSKEEKKAFIRAQSSNGCATDEAKPPVRSIKAIRGLTLEKGAFLLKMPDNGSGQFTTDVCLSDTKLEMASDDCNESDLIDTSIELLKLMGLQSHPAQDNSLQDRKMVILRLMEDRGQQTCGYTRRWPM